MFCTNGILLRMLTQPQGLDRVTHLVMDEVHERDCFADFLLIVLKQARPVPSLQHLQAQTWLSAVAWAPECRFDGSLCSHSLQLCLPASNCSGPSACRLRADSYWLGLHVAVPIHSSFDSILPA